MRPPNRFLIAFASAIADRLTFCFRDPTDIAPSGARKELEGSVGVAVRLSVNEFLTMKIILMPVPS
jgi:hypothetical protein